MKNEFNYLTFISSLLEFSPRQLEGEVKTAAFLLSFLRKRHIGFRQQFFLAKVPRIKSASLTADAANISCRGCCFVAGKIIGKESLISSLISSRFYLEGNNINFNPECPAISCSNFYFAPALAVAPKDLSLIIRAQKIRGTVDVLPEQYKAINILVGNLNNPRVICFAHYDSILKGAVDNASGVSILMEAIINNPKTLKNVLYVFSAQEELSYDKPVYWGRGFRVFEKSYPELLKKTKKIIVVDCVGNGKPNLTNNSDLMQKSFPINNLRKLQKKIFSLYGDIGRLMAVYHSDLDDIKQLKENYLKATSQKLLKAIYAD